MAKRRSRLKLRDTRGETPRNDYITNGPNPMRGRVNQAHAELDGLNRMLREAHRADTSAGRRNHVSVHDAAEHLGLSGEQRRAATKLISEVARDTRSLFNIAKDAREQGFKKHEVKEILHRGSILSDRVRRGESIGDDSLLTKAEKPDVEEAQGEDEIHPEVLARFNHLHAQARNLRHPLQIDGDLKPGHTHDHLDRLQAKIREHSDAQDKYGGDGVDEQSPGEGAGDSDDGEASTSSASSKRAEATPGKRISECMAKLKAAEPAAHSDAQHAMLEELHEAAEHLKGTKATPEACAWLERRTDALMTILGHDSMSKARRGGGPPASLGDIRQHADGTFAVKVSESPDEWKEFSSYEHAVEHRKQVMAGTAGPMVTATPHMSPTVGAPVLHKGRLGLRKALSAGDSIERPKPTRKSLRAAHPTNEHGHRDELQPGQHLQHHRGDDVLVKGRGRFEYEGVTYINGKELLNAIYGHARHGMTVRRYFHLGGARRRTYMKGGQQQPGDTHQDSEITTSSAHSPQTLVLRRGGKEKPSSTVSKADQPHSHRPQTQPLEPQKPLTLDPEDVELDLIPPPPSKRSP